MYMQLTTTLYIVITGIYEVAITELQYFAALVYIAIAGCSLLVSLLRFTTNERIARDGELKGAFIHP